MFQEDWKWNPERGYYERIVVHEGKAYWQHRYPGHVLNLAMAEAREQERRPCTDLGMERVAIVPNYLLEKWQNEGEPVFDPDCGNDAVAHMLRKKEYEYLRTGAGNARI